MVQVARRITLQRLMPDAAKTFSLLFTKLEIQEPCFTDVVILYRKSKQVLDRPGTEKDPLPAYGQVSYFALSRCHMLLPHSRPMGRTLICMQLA